MDILNRATIEELYWQDARDDIVAVNPDLAKVIDNMDPSKEYTLFRVRYPFGALILDEGRFLLPLVNGNIVSIDDPLVPKNTRARLAYNRSNPAGVMINNAAELFMKLGEHVIPFSMMSPGKIFGLWRALDPQFSYHQEHVWSICSGARSLLMMPKISDAISHRRLQREYGLRIAPAKNLHDQWQLFTELANRPQFPQPWHTEILFFSNTWFEEKDDDAWIRFHHFLLRQSWYTAYFWRNQFIWDFIFSRAQVNRNLKPNPYLADTAKYLLAVGEGVAPGFKIATDDMAAPISTMQQIYLESYQLKNYAPLFMHLKHFDIHDYHHPVYYSLQYPTTSDFSLKSRRLSSAMEELREIRHIMRSVQAEILSGKLNMGNTPLYELANVVDFQYYHSDKDQFGEISSSKNLPEHDPAIQSQLAKFPGRVFPETSPFVRGCIRIGVKA